MLPRTGLGFDLSHVSRMIRMPSSRLSKRSFREGNGMWYAECSASYQPAPTPRTSRPPERMSTEVAILASTAGGRKVIGETLGPKVIRLVHSAQSASDTHVSMQSRWYSPITLKK